MAGFSYKCVTVDHCIYMHTTEKGTSFVTIHVDDMLACASTEQEMNILEEDLWSLFEIKDLGNMHWLLGMAITCNQQCHTVSLSQAAYVDMIIRRFRKFLSNPGHQHWEPEKCSEIPKMGLLSHTRRKAKHKTHWIYKCRLGKQPRQKMIYIRLLVQPWRGVISWSPWKQ